MSYACPTFRELLSPDDWSVFASLARRRVIPADTLLYREGDSGGDVAVIDRGWTKVTTCTEDGLRAFLAVRGPGDIVGEMAAPGGLPRSADVRSVDQVEVLRLNRQDFLSLLSRHPGISLALVSVLADRLRAADRWRVRGTTWSVPRRLAALLAELSAVYRSDPDSDGRLSLPFSQEELGGFIGGSRRSVSRTLRQLRSDDVVETARGNLIVLDGAKLRHHAE